MKQHMDEFYGAFISFLDPASRLPLLYIVVQQYIVVL